MFSRARHRFLSRERWSGLLQHSNRKFLLGVRQNVVISASVGKRESFFDNDNGANGCRCTPMGNFLLGFTTTASHASISSSDGRRNRDLFLRTGGALSLLFPPLDTRLCAHAWLSVSLSGGCVGCAAMTWVGHAVIDFVLCNTCWDHHLSYVFFGRCRRHSQSPKFVTLGHHSDVLILRFFARAGPGFFSFCGDEQTASTHFRFLSRCTLMSCFLLTGVCLVSCIFLQRLV